MRSPSSLHPMLRSVHVLALIATFGACGGGDGPLDPASEPTTDSAADSAASGPVPTDGLAALITSQRIAFVSNRGGIPGVLKMDPQGSQLAPVFMQSDGVRAPAWSWDNKRVALVRVRWNNGVWRNDIWVVNADRTNGHWARTQPSVWHFDDPSWSPNGSRIVMTVNVGGTTKTLGWIDQGTSKAGLFFRPAGGAILGTRPSYNKAGTKILYVGEHSTTIDQINPDGSGHQVRITANAKVDYPSFSPDGGRIAYEKVYAAANTDIFVKTLSTGTTARVTWSTAGDHHPSWSPDGIRLAFTSERTGLAQIYTMKAATGGDLLQLTHTAAWENDPAWSH
jgi:Tol biopolymer transport system component